MSKRFRFATSQSCEEQAEDSPAATGTEVVLYMIAGGTGGVIAAGLALMLDLSLGWILIAYSLGGTGWCLPPRWGLPSRDRRGARSRLR